MCVCVPPPPLECSWKGSYDGILRWHTHMVVGGLFDCHILEFGIWMISLLQVLDFVGYVHWVG